jgi:GR25 family glycosyltransferase involved in LPS biosynthesis
VPDTEERIAYMLTCDEKSDRTIFSKKVLEKIGFDVKIVKCINKGNNKIEKIISNKIGMKNIYEIIKNSNQNYSYVFEDDINVVEEIKLFEIIEYEKISEMFFYLGACSPNFPTARNTGKVVNGHAVCAVTGVVKCLHAIGLSRKGAEELIKFFEEEEEVLDDTDSVSLEWGCKRSSNHRVNPYERTRAFTD